MDVEGMLCKASPKDATHEYIALAPSWMECGQVASIKFFIQVGVCFKRVYMDQ